MKPTPESVYLGNKYFLEVGGMKQQVVGFSAETVFAHYMNLVLCSMVPSVMTQYVNWHTETSDNTTGTVSLIRSLLSQLRTRTNSIPNLNERPSVWTEVLA